MSSFIRIGLALGAVLGPLLRFLNKRRTTAAFSVEQLQTAEFHLGEACRDSKCKAHAETVARESRRYVSSEQGSVFKNRFRATACLIDLRLYQSCAAYLAAVSKATEGKYRRSANKAKRLGYYVRPVNPASFSKSVQDIRGSKFWRSRGPMLSGFLARSAHVTDEEHAVEKPSCREHWTIAWGVFSDAGGKRKMVGRAVLRRSGNVVSFDEFMGHGDLLALGITKLLMFDIMEWILDRTDPCVQGLDYCLQGSMEDGGKGLVDWKRYTQFEPRSIKGGVRRMFQIPDDFDVAQYLKLNPDVKDAGLDARRHYVSHGVHEGRAYRE